jgi:hypothetical protein
MTVSLFRSTDYYKAYLLYGARLEHWCFFGGVAPVLDYMERSQAFWTVWEGDEIVFIAGYHRVWPDVCEVSFFPTKLFVKHPIGTYKLLKEKLEQLTKECKRVQMNCRNEEVFVRFALRLGFIKEGVLRKFGYDGTDHIMMAIVEGA